MPPQPLNPYDQRDRMPQPPQQPPMASRQPSPPRDPMRPYQEPQRPPPPAHRGLSPSPKNQHSTPYQPAPLNQLPQHPPYGAHQGPPPQLPMQGAPPFGGPPSSVPPPPNGMQAPAGQGPMPPYTRQSSPRPEIRPLMNTAPPTPGGTFPRTPYEHHANPITPQIANGAPPPSNAQYAADAAAREREERPGSTAPKRIREWEEDQSVKKPATEEARSRLDEIKMNRQSPPHKVATPPNRSPTELRRLEENRPPSTYRPSEASHHPSSLPSMHTISQQQPAQPMASQQPVQPPQQPSPPRASAPPQEEHRAPPPSVQPVAPQQAPVYEPAARKMEMDENYDDSGDDDKRSAKQESRRNSPKPANGGPPPAPAVEQQT